MKTAVLFSFLTFLAVGPARTAEPADVPRVDIIGSELMLPLMKALADAAPDSIEVAATGSGSGVGIGALKSDTTDLASSSRPIRPSEKEEIEKDGRKVTEVVIAYDAVVIFVHPDNALKSISVEELKQVWKKGGKLRQWNRLAAGLPSNSVELYGPPHSSGSAAALSGLLSGKGMELAPEIQQGADGKAVVSTVAKELFGIGYAKIDEVGANDKVKLLPVSVAKGGTAVTASAETIGNGTWPLSQPLYLYTTKVDDPKVKTFLEFVKSRAGRDIVVKAGYAAPKEAGAGGDSATK